MSTFSNNSTIKIQSGFSGNYISDGVGARNRLVTSAAINEYAIFQAYFANLTGSTIEISLGLTSQAGTGPSVLDTIFYKSLAANEYVSVQGLYLPNSSSLYYGDSAVINGARFCASGIVFRNTP